MWYKLVLYILIEYYSEIEQIYSICIKIYILKNESKKENENFIHRPVIIQHVIN